MPVNAIQQHKTVADPIAPYESMLPIWRRNRAICGGERFAKEYDNLLDVRRFQNLLVPFSTNMSQEQFNFFKAEAELPGITSEYAKMIVGGLLRKKPQLSLPEGIPEEAMNWLINDFGIDGTSLSIFLDGVLWEEMQTSRCWIQVDYPTVENMDNMTKEDFAELRPYPIKWNAESVVNWSTARDSKGRTMLSRVIIRTYEEEFRTNEFHADLIDTVYVHELVDGLYQIRKFQSAAPSTVEVVNGQKQTKYEQQGNTFELVSVNDTILVNGKRLDFIPIWPANGNIEVVEPILTPIIDKEVALYNKISRRNHLLYGASTYTPWISSDMSEEDFGEIVDKGLGTWIRLRQGDAIGVLATPSEPLADMEKSIASAIEEMARLGIRMLSPEVEQSGVALQLRNASQTAKLGTLNMRISTVFQDILAFMLNWRYGLELRAEDINFSLSDDFSPVPLGEGWLRLVTEWYEGGLIPRSVWLNLLKQNDIIPPEYDDDFGKQEISEDEMIISRAEQNAQDMALNSNY
jgi:hypothetical protein